MSSSNLDVCKEELQQLKDSLKEALLEKYEAAQCGLKLLEEKEHLRAKLYESDELVVQLRRELYLAQEKCNEQNEFHRKMSRVGFQEEDDILSRSANVEEQLSGRIKDLEHDLKSTKGKYERQMAENDKLHQMLQEVQSKYDVVEKIRLDLKQEIKAMKTKETLLLSELDELESENLDLQKNVLSLKTSQIEFESLKHELKRGQEENDLIHVQLEEVTRLKRITEKSLEEALESLQIEREQRHTLKKEMDSRLAFESFYHLNSVKNDLTQVVQSPSSSTILEYSKSDDANAHKGEDLFHELQLSESTQYKSELTELQHKLEEVQRSAELATCEVTSKQERINQLQNELDLIMGVQRRADSEFESNVTVDGTDTAPNDEESASVVLKRTLRQTEMRYSVALRQIASMQHELWRYQELEQMNANPSLAKESGLKVEVLRLRKELENRADEIKHLEDRIDINAKGTHEAGLKAAGVSEHLRQSFTQLLKLYFLVCVESKEAPSKQVCDLAAHASVSLDPNAITDDSTASDPTADALAVGMPTSLTEAATAPVSPEALAKQVQDQSAVLSHMRYAVQMFAKKSALLNQMTANGNAKRGDDTLEELQAELLHMQGKLNIKRQQVASLRSVLKKNKSVAETALANLKQKYENEKSYVTDTMRSLRAELKVLKEDAFTHASVRAMFREEHDNLAQQLDQLQEKLNIAEEEKRTLNSILRLAITQKLALTQQIEARDLERLSSFPVSARMAVEASSPMCSYPLVNPAVATMPQLISPTALQGAPRAGPLIPPPAPTSWLHAAPQLHCPPHIAAPHIGALDFAAPAVSRTSSTRPSIYSSPPLASSISPLPLNTPHLLKTNNSAAPEPMGVIRPRHQQNATE